MQPTSQKNCLFLLKKKIGALPIPSPSASYGAGKIKKCKGNFSARLCSDEQDGGEIYSSIPSTSDLKVWYIDYSF